MTNEGTDPEPAPVPAPAPTPRPASLPDLRPAPAPTVSREPLNDATLDWTAPSDAAALTHAFPAEIGGYRILGILGQGGMGIVYDAEQPSPRRRVALKLIRGSGPVDDVRLRMFEREVATLARLDHPSIGRIYASGRTEDGRHFFSMELVRGPSLADWLAGRPATPDRAEIEFRLRLFRQICDAVHYAHQRGVIHRDLKPSNLIVSEASARGTSIDAVPIVKILDFGLARMTEEDVAATQLTEVGMIKGTLAYMAPEQASGASDAIDIRTDVYALGVILHELLTGRRPYDVPAASILAAVRVICEEPPSTLGADWRASVRCDPDLATIVATAIAKDPDMRYAGAAAFSEDVGRFLASQPIQARPPSFVYQFRKLASRKKGLFVTASAALVVLVVAAISMGLLYVRSEANLSRALEAEQLARREAETAERTSDFMVELFDHSNPERTRGETVTAREVMDEGARRIGDELSGEPLLQSRLMYTIGQVYLSLGLYDKARDMGDRALSLRRANLPAGSIEIAASLHLLARVLQAEGVSAEAKAAFGEAIDTYEKLGAKGVDGLIDTLGNLSWMLGQTGEFNDALRAAGRAMDLAQSKNPPDEDRILRLLTNRSTIQMNMGKLDSALVVLNRALGLTRRLNGERHHETANVLTNLGVLYGLAGHPDSAATRAAEALAINRAIYGDSHPMVIKSLANVGIFNAQQGKFAEARPYLEEVLAALRKIYKEDNPAVIRAWLNLGLLKLQSGDTRGAIADLQKAVDLGSGTRGEETMSVSTALYHLAEARGRRGEFAVARDLLMRSVAIDERIQGPDSKDVADDLEALAEVERHLGDKDGVARIEARVRGINERLRASAAAS
jgi:eukaryotic-like serine/threonine-protein kinase